MAREALSKEVSNFVDRSLEFQRYFSLLRVLQSKKSEEEQEIAALKELLNAAVSQGEQQKCRQLATKIMVKYKKVYGLSKQKQQICRKSQEFAHRLTNQFNAYREKHQKNSQSIKKSHETQSKNSLQYIEPQSKRHQSKTEQKYKKLSHKLSQNLINSPNVVPEEYDPDQTTLSLEKLLPPDEFNHIKQHPLD